MMSPPKYLDIREEKFLDLVHPMARLERLATGFTWVEGPVWFGDHGCLFFSDIPSRRILRWSESDGLALFRENSGFNNGNTRDNCGRLVGCRHGFRDVVRTEWDGSITVLASEYNGRRLNSPNDVVVTSDGTIWFTDPTYGILGNFEGFRAEAEQPARYVFRVRPGGNPEPMISDFIQPNGLAFSPDEKRLYVAESGRSHDTLTPAYIRQFDLLDDGSLIDVGILAEIDVGFPDGLRVDMAGNIWASAGDGVHCISPAGHLLGKILVPETVANLCFGGSDGQRLFITATSSVYRIFVGVKGAEKWTRSSIG